MITESKLSEDQLQAKCYQWFWNNFPELRRTMWAVPNGGIRNKITAMKMKATGLLSGVHDIHFVHDGTLHSIELKVGKNQLTESQVKYAQAIMQQGAKCHVVRTFEEFEELIKGIVG